MGSEVDLLKTESGERQTSVCRLPPAWVEGHYFELIADPFGLWKAIMLNGLS